MRISSNPTINPTFDGAVIRIIRDNLPARDLPTDSGSSLLNPNVMVQWHSNNFQNGTPIRQALLSHRTIVASLSYTVCDN